MGGGVLTKEDLAEYQPRVGEPMSTSFRDYTIMTVPAPIGGQTVLETLNILENFNLQSLGHNTPEYLHLFIECTRHAFADRFRYLADWEVAPVPIQGLLSKEYAKEIAQQVDLEKAALEEPDEEPWVFYLERALHDPWKFDRQPRPTATFGPASTSTDGIGSTTHFNVVDNDRNVVCCTHFGGFSRDGGIPPGTGIYLEGGMGKFIPKAGYANSVAGWMRPLTNDAPLMILKDGNPILCVGAPGGRKIINRVTQVSLNVLEFGMGIQDAIAMPIVDASTRVTLVDSRLPREVISRLEAMGHGVKVVEEDPGRGGSFARPSGIFLDYDTNLLHGGVEIFRRAIALGH